MVRWRRRAAGSRRSFPHTRGDGPFSTSVRRKAAEFSPHAWGWSGSNFAPRAIQRVFPTRVGMVRTWETSPTTQGRFPHTRGDGPSMRAIKFPVCGFSPHAWGWSGVVDVDAANLAVFPTRVGMVRMSQKDVPAAGRFPHTRGDGPDCCAAGTRAVRFSPHAWGWSEDINAQLAEQMVFPTRVGMVRGYFNGVREPERFPHTRGDGPAIRKSDVPPCRFSPHAWGWSAPRPPRSTLAPVFPTRVGMVRILPPEVISAGSFPHTRGDGPTRMCNRRPPMKFSPHAWGWSAKPKAAKSPA